MQNKVEKPSVCHDLSNKVSAPTHAIACKHKFCAGFNTVIWFDQCIQHSNYCTSLMKIEITASLTVCTVYNYAKSKPHE